MLLLCVLSASCMCDPLGANPQDDLSSAVRYLQDMFSSNHILEKQAAAEHKQSAEKHKQSAAEDKQSAAEDNQSTAEDKRQVTPTIDQIISLARQIMLQQLHLEESVRSDGGSGLKTVRTQRKGTQPYHGTTHSAKKLASIHNHDNNIRTVGMGEFIAVLNGVEFRTRHNDYGLRMPDTNSSNYHSVVDIPYPSVPPEVTDKETVQEQIEEMTEWFRAWKEQDDSVRDYKKYFKPVLCYLEGAWTNSQSNELDESFDSDRHFIDAKSWYDLQEKIRFTSNTGSKDSNENFAYLPTTILEVLEDGTPVFAQWNFRILCHPIKRDIPLNRLQVVDDINLRMATKKSMAELAATRAARFALNEFDTDNWKDGFYTYGLIDELMAEIPGKDNYNAVLRDTAFGENAYNFNLVDGEQVPLNAAYYHRKFKKSDNVDAGGLITRRRGFHDEEVFMALTSHPQIAEFKVEQCKKEVCASYKQRMSYAIPLELIYLTPLYNWNPFDIEYHGKSRKPAAARVTANKRNGGKTLSKAYDGTESKIFYRCPDAFFSGGEVDIDPADTSQSSIGVLDKNGSLQIVRASGTRIFLPNIPGVGILRTRYPIMPIHGEGSAVWKELSAIKDILMEPKKYSYMFRENIELGGGPDHNTGSVDDVNEAVGKEVYLETSPSFSNNVNIHIHTLTLSVEEVIELLAGKDVISETTLNNGHAHIMVLYCPKRDCHIIKYRKCDGKRICVDRHEKTLTKVQSEVDPLDDNL